MNIKTGHKFPSLQLEREKYIINNQKQFFNFWPAAAFPPIAHSYTHFC